jgi:hypothetical protein
MDESRRARGRLGALVLHATHDSREITANARKAFLGRFEIEVDPNGKLTPEERARRAEYARKAYFQRLAMASAKARRSKKEGRAPAEKRGPKISTRVIADDPPE